MSIKIVVSGACGRMGKAIARLAIANPEFELTGLIEAKGHQDIGRDCSKVAITDDAKKAMKSGDVTIEFTRPDVTLEHAQIAKEIGKPIVIGTTGLTEDQIATLRDLGSSIPIVFSPNMSLGVNVLFNLVRDAAKQLGLDYDVDVSEAHHRHKKDSPSGTAKRLTQILAAVRNVSEDKVPTHAVRAGEIIGDHTVQFTGELERIELTHKAQSRDVFAQGSLEAVRFLISQQPGFYGMSDVLEARVKQHEVGV